MRFMTSAPAPVLHITGTSPSMSVATVIAIGPHARNRRLPDGIDQVERALENPPALVILPGNVQVLPEHDRGLSVQSRQGDEADPDGDAEVVVQDQKRHEGSAEGQWDPSQHKGRCEGRSRADEQHREDDHERKRDKESQSILDPLHGLELAAPGERIAWRHRYAAIHSLTR